MQRMLVALVLVLTVAVGGLGLWTLHLSGQVSEQSLLGRRSPPTVSRSVRRTGAVDEERVAEIARRAEALEQANGRLRERLQETERSLRAMRESLARLARASSAGDGPSGDGDGGPSRWEEGGADRWGADGEPIVTPEDEEFFLAVQQRVERRRRVQGMSRNVMRRVDRLVERGEIGRLTPEIRLAVEEQVRDYVARGDDLVTRYVREPDEEVSLMTREERTEAMREERDRIVAEAQRDLEPLVGQQDAALIADVSLQNPWGLRLNRDRTGGR